MAPIDLGGVKSLFAFLCSSFSILQTKVAILCKSKAKSPFRLAFTDIVEIEVISEEEKVEEKGIESEKKHNG